jgi:hypothetical protein
MMRKYSINHKIIIKAFVERPSGRRYLLLGGLKPVIQNNPYDALIARPDPFPS